MVGAYAPCAKFIKLAYASGLKVVFHNVSFVGSQSLAAALGGVPADVLVTQVVPHPAQDPTAITREFLEDLKALDGAAKPGFGELEGYIAARILLAALERIPGPPTREGIIEALEGLGRFDLGLGEPLTLSPSDHQACHRVWLTRLQQGEFLPFPWEAVTGLLQPEASR
jgi:ABC-type branched-subunit amino acid transport system substrate-binding protein